MRMDQKDKNVKKRIGQMTIPIWLLVIGRAAIVTVGIYTGGSTSGDTIRKDKFQHDK